MKKLLGYIKNLSIIKDIDLVKRLFLSLKQDNNIFSNTVSFNALRGKKIFFMNNAQIDNSSSIGSYSYVGYNSRITRAEIGRYVSIGNNVSIGIGEHDLSEISTSSLFYDNPLEMLTSNKCVIGNDVWIGVDSIIRRGVTIGNGAVIGANSFVNKDVPDFAIVVGSPAKVIKYRFNPKQIELINQSTWWNLDYLEAKEVVKKLKVMIHELV